MSPAPWILEWRRALARPRLFAMNVTIPALLVGPVALSDAPGPHAAAVYAVLFVLFATFGSAIPLVRDGESGLLRRIALTGTSARSLLLQRAGVATVLDLLQLLPSALLVVLVGGGGHAGPALALSLAGSLLVANLVGFWAAALARSVAETALFAAVSGLLLLHASGTFRTPVPGSAGAAVEAASPFASLHGVLLGVEAGAPRSGVDGHLALGLWCAAAILFTWLLAPALVGAVVRSRPG